LFAQLKQKEIEDLKKNETYRKEFIADISHELKTPIFAAQGYIYTLLDGAKDDAEVSEKFLKKAAKSLDGLDELVQDLLTLSEIEMGAAKMKKEQFDIFQIVNEVFDQLDKKASKKKMKLISDRNVEKPILVIADQKRIFQVLRNLVENGIKYGFDEGGYVLVKIRQELDSVEVQVEDNGTGITSDDQKRIFERFYRVEKSRSKDKGGSGLGLAIASQIIEAHKSKIFVSSKPGKGAVFSFKLFSTKN
jgi:two-component system phosphate regulon sensor histidine kinase PhoR